MYKMLKKNITTKDGVDDIFEKLYESDNDLKDKPDEEIVAK